MKLILASTSKYRKTLLVRLGLPFEVIGSDYDERQHDALFDQDAGTCAVTIAAGKAQTVQDKVEDDAWVLGADQIVWTFMDTHKRIQFHKPGTEEEAVEQLMKMRGRIIYSTTGIVLLNKKRNIHSSAISVTELWARDFSFDETKVYVKGYKPLDCAGSFRMEDPGITLFDKIEGDWTGGQGFPLMTVARMFRQVGLLPA